jgi:hypothetical protein
MSVSITQQPTSPNVANTKLLYVVSSSLTSNPQYKYVADVFLSGSSTRLDRLKTIPNPTGGGIFDISVEVINNLDYDNNWKATSTLNTGSSKIFIVKFGEEYGTSPSSSVTIYDGAGSPGDPSITSSNLLAINGVVNPAEINSFNFDYEKFDTSSFTSVNQGNVAATYNDLRGPKLSNYPYGWQNATGSITHPISIDTSDYETISFLRLNPISSASYTSSSLYVYYDNPISLFTSSFVIDNNAGTTDVLTLGVGPQNLMSISSNVSSSFTGSWSLYEVEVKYENLKNGNEASSSYWYMNEDLCNTDFLINFPIQLQGKNPPNKGLYDGIRFAFINQYGTWDYYTIYGPTSKNTKVKRENVVLSQADYSAASSVYDISRRSKTQYYASLNDEISITTEYLEEDEANWLTELFESPLVFEQLDDDFIPVVITNAEYMWKTENKNKKLFQYTIRYKRSNERRSRL